MDIEKRITKIWRRLLKRRRKSKKNLSVTNEQLQKEMQEKCEEIGSIKNSKDQLEKDKIKITTELSEGQQKLSNLETQFEASVSEVASLRQGLGQVEKEIEKEREK